MNIKEKEEQKHKYETMKISNKSHTSVHELVTEKRFGYFVYISEYFFFSILKNFVTKATSISFLNFFVLFFVVFFGSRVKFSFHILINFPVLRGYAAQMIKSILFEELLPGSITATRKLNKFEMSGALLFCFFFAFV